MMDTIEIQKPNSGILTTARLKQIHKDRQHRPADQKRRKSDKPPDSNSSSTPHSEPIFPSEDMEEDIHLRNELEEAFAKILSFPHKNRETGATEQGTRIDVTI
jgi:hypothetical protein